MKHISSSAGSLTAGTRETSEDFDPDSTAHGSLGYRVSRPRSSSDEDEDQPPAPPAISRPQSVLPSVTATFQQRLPLPPSKPVTVVLPSGKTRNMLALANDSDLSIIRAEIEALTEELEPVHPKDVAVTIRKLLGHFGVQAPTDPVLLKEWASDWIADMRGISSKAFHAAVTTWRQSTERFRPTPGQILAIAREIELPTRKRLDACFELEWVATRTTQHKQLEG